MARQPLLNARRRGNHWPVEGVTKLAWHNVTSRREKPISIVITVAASPSPYRLVWRFTKNCDEKSLPCWKSRECVTRTSWRYLVTKKKKKLKATVARRSLSRCSVYREQKKKYINRIIRIINNIFRNIILAEANIFFFLPSYKKSKRAEYYYTVPVG